METGVGVGVITLKISGNNNENGRNQAAKWPGEERQGGGSYHGFSTKGKLVCAIRETFAEVELLWHIYIH